MEDQTKGEEEAKQRAELARTPNAAKSDKDRKKAAKQIDPQRLYEAIQHLKKYPKPP
jgi:hypothetical protein